VGLCFISIERLHFESVRNGDVLLSEYGSKKGEGRSDEKVNLQVCRTGAVYPAKVGSSKFNMMDSNMFYLCMLLDMCLLVEYEHEMLFLFIIFSSNMWIIFCIFASQTNQEIFI
jgi:hypothetical protein